MAPQVVNANDAQAAALRANAQALEAQAHAAAAPIAARFAWWDKLRNLAAQFDVDMAKLVGSDVVAINNDADKAAKLWARTMVNLDAGTAELLTHQTAGGFIVGAVATGTVKRLMGYPIAPLFVVGGTNEITWLALNAWEQMAEAVTFATRAKQANDDSASALKAKAAIAGGMMASRLTQALELADDASHTPAIDVFAKLAGSLVAPDQGGGGGGGGQAPLPDDSGAGPLKGMVGGVGGLLLIWFLWSMWQKRKTYKRVKGWLT